MKNIFFSFLLLVFASQISAQIKLHKNISTEDGLVQGQINVITKDSSGYMWFGTYGGVSRWDGNNFYNLTTYNGLTASQIMDIEIGIDSTIYLAPYGGGVMSFKDGKLDTLLESNGLATNWISEICVLKNGDVLFGGYEGNISLLKNDSITQWIDPSLLNKKSVWEIYEAKDGSIFIGTYQGGFFHLTKNGIKNYSEKDGLTNQTVWTFFEKDDGTMLIGTYNGLFNFANGKINKLLNHEKVGSVYNIKSDKNGNIFSTSSEGLRIFNNNDTLLINQNNGLSINELWDINIGENGTVFIGTNGNGVDIYYPFRIENYYTQNGLPNNNVWSILETKNDNLLIGTDDGLAIKSDDTINLLNENNGLTGKSIRSLYQSSDGKIYVGTKSGLNILHKNKIEKLTAKDGLIDNQIFDIAETYDHKILIATREGVSIIHNNSIENLTEENGLASNYVQTIYAAPDSTIYFGTYGLGITSLRNGIYKNITKENGLSDQKIQTIAQNKNGDLFVGTYEGGLNIIKNDSVKTITIDDGLSSNSIQSIAFGEDNLVYLGTLKSLNVVDLTNEKPNVRIINSEEGLADNDCNREATIIDSKNNLWVGTKNGLTLYNPKFDKKNSQLPKIYITGFQIYNQDYPIEKLLQERILSYDQNYLKFTYTGINLSAPNKISYKYKLSGVDIDWVESNIQSVQYTNLDDGNYTFEVKTKNEWGYWSEPAKLAFTINSAWWETWWFYTITFFTVAGLIAFIASYRYRHLLAVEKVRNKISTDLHDSIGSGLTEITFLSEMVKSQVKENENANKGLNNISGISKNLVDEMRDIVWLVNPNKDSLKDLFYRLQDSYQEVLRFSNIDLIVNGIENLSKIRLPMTYRQNIYLMFKEAINNSVKYSNCSKIVIDVNTNFKKLCIELADDGKGFDMATTKLGNGVGNIKNRAEAINGSAEIISSINNGTKIIFEGKFSKLKISEV